MMIAAVSVTVMAMRHRVMGDEVYLPGGPGTWKVTLLATGTANADARLHTMAPLEIGNQHVFRESHQSLELNSRVADNSPAGTRFINWSPKAQANTGKIRAKYECVVTMHAEKPNADAATRSDRLYVAPQSGDYLGTEAGITPTHPEITDQARDLVTDLSRIEDQAEALFRFVDQHIHGEPTLAGHSPTAAECLKLEAGDSLGKCRLLVSLMRNRGIPSRLVTGLTLARDTEQTPHVWAELWLRGHWIPACPFHHYYGRIPRNYLILGFGDLFPVRGKNVRGLDYSYRVERVIHTETAASAPSRIKRWFRAISFHFLPPAEQQLVEFLLLLPVAALVICVTRNVVGVSTFGTFAPALIGLAFRDLRSLPGVLVFIGILLIGWLMRRSLNRFHLLQVPRTAMLLTLVILVIITFIMLSNRFQVTATRYISLFPMVILTGMIERFWTLEEEDSTGTSFRTLFSTLAVAGVISVVVSRGFLIRFLFAYPESLGVVMAVQMLLGRYTGYRLLELYRFREFLRPPVPPEPTPVLFQDRRPFSGRF
jgi:hypothetical protein